MGRIVLVIGGTRSGKSAYALSRARGLPGRRVYLATAQAGDKEMTERIQKHRQERGPGWTTREEPVHLGRVVRELASEYDVVVIDCLTIWLSNLLCGPDGHGIEENDFVDSLGAPGPSIFFIVSNEVGLGIVPENELARKFRDLAGELNQRIAKIADEVLFITAGLPLKIK
jgi:adenosylcobinamide kinase/adenosylcobinamide-phosphate guanylyltransferase